MPGAVSAPGGTAWPSPNWRRAALLNTQMKERKNVRAVYQDDFSGGYHYVFNYSAEDLNDFSMSF